MFHTKSVTPLPSHDSPEELAEIFSLHFMEKIRKLRQKLQQDTVRELPLFSCHSSFTEFQNISMETVRNIIVNAPSKSCAALDPIPTRTLKACLDTVLPVITAIINSSLESGIFPQKLKEGRISPALKNTSLNQDDFCNYRPITNLAFVSKVLERVVAGQSRNYLVNNNLYPSLQSAYREFHSTETALLRVHNDILRAIDNKKEVVLVLLDLSSAFDTIDHDILISRLRTQFGFSGTVLSWFKSYLTNRSQRVVINNTISTSQPLAHGVPQGSVLGPLLFILYFAPLQDIIRSHDLDCMMYADDSQIYITIQPTCRELSLERLDLCIKDVKEFFHSNMLACNIRKTDIVHFLSRYSRIDPISSVSVGDVNIVPSPQVRNLGVIFDTNMSMSAHVNKICRSGHHALRSIGRIRKYLSPSSTERLVHAFITSKVDYCNSLLFGISTSDLAKLQRLQNSAARLVTRTKRSDHISPVLYNLHWLPVSERIKFKILLITYKIINDLAPSYLQCLVTRYTPARNLRSTNQGLLSVPKSASATYGDRAFSVAAPRLWNQLPLHIKNSESVNQFKSLLKTHLFENSFNF